MAQPPACLSSQQWHTCALYLALVISLRDWNYPIYHNRYIPCNLAVWKGTRWGYKTGYMIEPELTGIQNITTDYPKNTLKKRTKRIVH
jgi:hypothetical protein